MCRWSPGAPARVQWAIIILWLMVIFGLSVPTFVPSLDPVTAILLGCLVSQLTQILRIFTLGPQSEKTFPHEEAVLLWVLFAATVLSGIFIGFFDFTRMRIFQSLEMLTLLLHAVIGQNVTAIWILVKSSTTNEAIEVFCCTAVIQLLLFGWSAYLLIATPVYQTAWALCPTLLLIYLVQLVGTYHRMDKSQEASGSTAKTEGQSLEDFSSNRLLDILRFLDLFIGEIFLGPQQLTTYRRRILSDVRFVGALVVASAILVGLGIKYKWSNLFYIVFPLMQSPFIWTTLRAINTGGPYHELLDDGDMV